MSREKLLAPFLSSLLRNSNVGSQSGARREYPGDVRDDVRIATLRKMVESRVDPPAFVTQAHGTVAVAAYELTRNHLPRMIRTEKESKEAEEDPFGAFQILRALQKEAKHISDAFIGIIHTCLQAEVFPEFTMLTRLDESGRLPYAKPRGGKTLAECAATILPPGFLDSDAFAPGRSSFYSQAIVQSSTSLKATVARMKITDKENAKTTDSIYYARATFNAELMLKQCLPFIGTTYAGETDRCARKRLKEKLASPQLFGRQARAAADEFIDGQLKGALAADDDDDDLADQDADGDDTLCAKLVIEAESNFAISDKVFATKHFVAAVARIGGKAYGARGLKLSDIEDDFEALVAATTGSMIANGGTNVAFLGCLPKTDQGRPGVLSNGRVAFRMINDAAFTAMDLSGEVDTFDKHRADVQGRLARDFFEKDSELLRLLEATALQLKDEGLSVLASDDAELLKKKPNAALPTVDDMDAGTFARALASAAGRKGGRTTAQMVADFRNPAITQPKQIADKTKKILGGMGGHTVDEHRDLSLGGRTVDELVKRAVAGGGTPPGGYDTAQATDAHKKACGGVAKTAIKYGFASKGFKIFRTSIVCEGDEHEFFTSCEPGRVDTVNCFTIAVTSLHGRLYEILDEGDGKSKSPYLFSLPHSNQTDIDKRGPDMLKPVRGTGRNGGFFSRSMIKVMKANTVTWTTAEYLITAKMLAVYEQEKKEKQRLARKTRERKVYK